MPEPDNPSHTRLSKEGLGNEIPKAKLNSKPKHFSSITASEGSKEREITEIKKRENKATQRTEEEKREQNRKMGRDRNR